MYIALMADLQFSCVFVLNFTMLEITVPTYVQDLNCSIEIPSIKHCPEIEDTGFSPLL